MFEIGALFRGEWAAVAPLKRRDLLVDRLEAEVVCESACTVASRGLWITDLGPCGAQLLTARVGSQQIVRNRRCTRRRIGGRLGRAEPSDLLEVCAVLRAVGGALGLPSKVRRLAGAHVRAGAASCGSRWRISSVAHNAGTNVRASPSREDSAIRIRSISDATLTETQGAICMLCASRARSR